MAKTPFRPKDYSHDLSLADVSESGSLLKPQGHWFGLEEIPALTTNAAVSANQAIFRSYRAPYACQLVGVTIFIDTTDGSSPGAGHNMELGVWDTGEATAASYTNLAVSTAATVPASATWFPVWNPDIALAEGQHFMLHFAADGTTVKFGKRADADNSAASDLNAQLGFTTSGGNSLKVAASKSSVYGSTTAISEANMAANKVLPVFLFKLTPR